MTERTYLRLDASGNAINVVVLDDTLPIPDFLTGDGETLVADYDGPWAPGAHYNGAVVEMPPSPDPVQAAVTTITAAQGKLALYSAGLLDQVTAAVDAYPPMKIFFDNSPYWQIGHPYIRGLAAELNLPDGEIAALFVAAAAL